ncbi:MAG TPA: hypothetical protein VHL30_02130 [Chlamydiales bacterium]|jgi:hypothetical protein|nr:hypothetical protein [Chlamydiales bacterium]
MKIECYKFFFHPLNSEFSTTTKALALITAIALTAISLGGYLALVAFVRWNEKSVQPVLSHGSARCPKLEHLKAKQAEHLAKLQKLPWRHLQTHTSHPDSGFDWWMFPIDRVSQGQGDKYQVNKAEIAALKKDPEFMQNYRTGVILVAKSWGWDLETGQDVTNEEQRWMGYQVRLGKMLHSLVLFDQNDLHQALVQCIDRAELRPSLLEWVQTYL